MQWIVETAKCKYLWSELLFFSVIELCAHDSNSCVHMTVY